MNKLHILLVGLLVLALSSCSDEMQQIAGTYTYKLTGTYSLCTSSSTTISPFNLEVGTLDLIRQSGDTLLMLLNPTSGAVAQGTAVWKDDKLEVLSIKRALTISDRKAEIDSIGDILQGNLGGVDVSRNQSFATTMTGEGSFYDGTLLLNLTLYGRELDGNHILISNDLTLIAKK